MIFRCFRRTSTVEAFWPLTSLILTHRPTEGSHPAGVTVARDCKPNHDYHHATPAT
ncbi:hypothetical protein RBSWK_00338 [Rhodopirellula baltica SWK14]|uniref:Uncharacterized protein n=1 Tax=Rhodopirellula baltica SWK14 TaxID=993516 RepID=L7CNT2_RHOBT|nr:hypothetical protein RBSWK_00338 [Rhodopirellula baltica SWK14]